MEDNNQRIMYFPQRLEVSQQHIPARTYDFQEHITNLPEWVNF